MFTIIVDNRSLKVVRLFEKLQLTKTAVVMYFCMRDPKTPVRVKVSIAGALTLYFNPLNWMLDVLFPGGYSYNDMVVLLVFDLARKYIKDEHRLLADKWLEWIPDHEQIIV